MISCSICIHTKYCALVNKLAFCMNQPFWNYSVSYRFGQVGEGVEEMQTGFSQVWRYGSCESRTAGPGLEPDCGVRVCGSRVLGGDRLWLCGLCSRTTLESREWWTCPWVSP